MTATVQTAEQCTGRASVQGSEQIAWLTDDVDRSQRFAVYHNRHHRGDKTKLWSVKIPNGRVVGYAGTLMLTDCQFVTRKSQIRAMWRGDGPRGTKKNVFAWVTGFLGAEDQDDGLTRVTFHPDEHDEFFVAQTGEDIYRADAVWFDADGKCWIGAAS